MAHEWISKTTARKWLGGVTDQAIQAFVKQGMPCRKVKGRVSYPWPEIRNWRDDQIRAQERSKLEKQLRPKEPTTLDEARLRKETAEAQLKELAVAEAEGRLIPMDIHERRYAASCDRLRAVLLTVPSKYLGRIQQARSDVEAHAVGEAIRDETLRALIGTADDAEIEPYPESEDANSRSAA